eukprot:3295435-Prymnesium_polylepis.1
MAVRALAAPWPVCGTLGGRGSIHQYPVCNLKPVYDTAAGGRPPRPPENGSVFCNGGMMVV